MKTSDMAASFSVPIPCSPLMVPPISTQTASISSLARRTRSVCSRSRLSNRMSGCRFPSPAWKTLPTLKS